MKPRAIHQFHNGCEYGDGITNGMLFTQRILRAAGYKSEIYCFVIDKSLAHLVKDARTYCPAPDDLLLVRYSLGTRIDEWISALPCKCILVYHNITPAEFFPEGSELRALSVSGRRQLAVWGGTGRFCGAIADSAYNAEELKAWGYPSVVSIGLLVDIERMREAPWNSEVAREFSGARNILFVGRICEHKGQIDLVRALHRLIPNLSYPVRLILCGGVTTATYDSALKSEIARLQIGGHVRLIGKRSDEDVYGLYRSADVYLSMSEHEGFGMPLVEAMTFDLPVLAYNAASVSATLGTGGLVFNDRRPEVVAGLVKCVLEEPKLRQQILDGQRKAVQRFSSDQLAADLEAYLQHLGFDVQVPICRRAQAPPLKVVVEGPFDSSYSLAIVNRELARALSKSGHDVGLVSRDGPGAYEPNASFLKANPDVAGLFKKGLQVAEREIGLRYQYPPVVEDLRGRVKAVCNFGWEESEVPAEWIDDFNTRLDFVAVLSSYVAKVLRDNGLRIPIVVGGAGVDHLPCETAHRPRSGGKVRFLHISSCFPRKGADALLHAWGKAFTRGDNVELVIKTFPNPHNDVERQIEALRATLPDAAPVVLINRDLTEQEINKLFADSHAVVLPSRGEGFGLPLAEALAKGLPVVTTAYGGQSDFCTEETAFLCDFNFTPAKSHFALPNSVWADPDIHSLAGALLACHQSILQGDKSRVTAGRNLVLRSFTWAAVAERTLSGAHAALDVSSTSLRLPRVGWVTTWNTRCGIAAYAESLACEIHPERLVVLAARTNDYLVPEGPRTIRAWNQGFDDQLDDLRSAVMKQEIDIVVIQFNFGFFNLKALQGLIEWLVERGIQVYLVLHSTADVIKPDVKISLGEISSALSKAKRLLVHSVRDLNRLKGFGLVRNVSLIPMGVPEPASGSQAMLRAADGDREETFVLASFGYLLPHKGLRELVRGFALVHEKQPKARLMMLNALYPVPESLAECEALKAEIDRTGLGDKITLLTDYLSEREAVERLSTADLIVFPYQATQESASAAVKVAMSSLAPIACTPLPIFEDVQTATHTLPGVTPQLLAEGILQIFAQKAALSQASEVQKKLVQRHQWPVISRRLDNMIRGEFAQPKTRAMT